MPVLREKMRVRLLHWAPPPPFTTTERTAAVANTKVSTDFISFDIQPEQTIVNVKYSSDEPGSPFWGGGTKKKAYPPSIPIVDILTKDIAALDYLTW